MEDDHSLLAHLVPKLTPQVEDAATDALAYILNQSESCREALASLVSEGGHQLLPVHRASTQVTVADDGRLDLVGYDADGSMRLIVESKFWAALLSGQASGYVKHLSADGKALAQQTEIAHEKDPGGPTWVPLRLLTGVEYSDVFDDVVAQVRAVRDIVLP